jgi:peroxin-3
LADSQKNIQFSPLLRRLLDETADLIESPSFSQVLTGLLDAGFSLLVDENIAVQAFKQPVSSTLATDKIAELSDPHAKAKLATILAVVTRQAHLIGNGVPNHYLQAMDQVGDLEAFSAVVYSSNFDSEIPGNGPVPPATPALSTTTNATTTWAESGVLVGGDDLTASTRSEASDFESAWGKATTKE